MNPLLAALATSYFAESHDYPGAPRTRPHAVKVVVGTGQNSQVTENWLGKKIANLCIHTRGMDHSCNGPRKHVAPENDPRVSCCRSHLRPVRPWGGWMCSGRDVVRRAGLGARQYC